jgi:uncharacterized protein (TIGR02594 family)
MPTARYRVIAQGLNVRSAPSLNGKIIGTLRRDDVVQALSQSGDDYWYKVKTAAGKEGWASHKYLERVFAPKATAAEEFPWMPIALSEKGVREFPGNGDNPRVLENLHSTTLGGPSWDEDETPWCSAFVNWCIERAGFEGTDSAWARSWLNWGKRLNAPRRGCITVFQRDTNAGHVAFFLEEVGGKVRVLGGNQSDQVNESAYSNSDVLGFRLPGQL